MINVSLINVFLVIFLTLCGVAHAGFNINPFTGRMDKTSASVSSGWSLDGSTTTETTRDVVIGGDLNVSGETTLEGNLTVGGSISAGVSGNSTFDADVAISGSLTVSGDSTFAGNLSVGSLTVATVPWNNFTSDTTFDGSIFVQGLTDLTANEPVGGAWAGNYNDIELDVDPTLYNFGGTSHQTVFNFYRKSRIRQDGDITAFETKVERIVDIVDAARTVTGVYLQVWRNRFGTNLYDRVGESENVYAQLVANSVVKFNLATPITARDGDYTALRVTLSGGFKYGPFKAAATGLQGYTYTTGNPPTENFAWKTAAGISSGREVIMNIYMQKSAQLAVIGDSIISGTEEHASYITNLATWDSPITTIPYKLAQKLGGVTYQNLGIPGDTSTGVKNRFQADVVDLKPKIAVIQVGVNDLLITSEATFIANYTTMLDLARANDIKVVASAILPYSNATNAKMQERDSKMAALETLINGSYSDMAIFVDASSKVGQYRKDGDAGNIWDMQTRYDNGDRLHYTADGHEAVASVIAKAINASKFNGTLEVGDLVVGDRIGFKPTPQMKYIELDRTQYEIDNYVYGASLLIGSGGAMTGQWNQNGGDLILTSGRSTGTGSSGVAIWTTTSSTSTTSDNEPTPSVTITGNGMLIDDAIYAKSPYLYMKQEDGGCSKVVVTNVGTGLYITDVTCPPGM